MKNRIQMTDISPVVDGGRFAAKATTSDVVEVSAVLFREGHDKVAGAVRHRPPGGDGWRELPMAARPQDRFEARFVPDEVGAWEFQVLGWTDHWASWLDGLVKKHQAGVADLSLEFEEGALLLERHAAGDDVPAEQVSRLERAAATLRDDAVPVHQRVDAARAGDLRQVLVAHPDRRDLTTSPTFTLWVDRDRAGFSAWYEMFPRSVGSDGRTSGTFKTAQSRLGEIAAMGFDVLYLPPIHPIGHAHRKGPNNTLIAGPDDPGVPWAIGSEAGGHTAVHPDLGTLEDFDDFVAAAGEAGLEVALDFAIQCSPDHPWVTEHPEWFRHRADGSIAYAENPPKKYQDIYPIDFDTEDIDGLCEELKGVLEFWIDRGIRIFRVDNPHTKALPFWEWVIDEIHQTDPGVLFLAEAFTRPAMMRQLAKLGFSQSYTYFTWRNTKHELTEYVTELAHTDSADYYRPNFWPNTPDILHEYLQSGSPAAFKVRVALAALLSPNYGMYSGYELLEHVPVRPGSEEYLDSEKYAYRPRDFHVDHSIAPFIARLNELRHSHRVLLGDLRNVWFHGIENDQLLAFSKTAVPADVDGVAGDAVPGRRMPDGPVPLDRLVVIANLDPHHAQEGMTALDMWQLGMDGVDAPYDVHDLLTGHTWTWQGPRNYVRLDPSAGEPVHVFHLRPHL
ncbi:alpha-1,4-glucan--maltose-1-phosphate maltosyltransferase [Euzebya sp.]|uniref:alpha-1,4-glucan--maltose-1-phosphate maltosyltransferase n=1 Tax=Euzebya sp. TaxID=1971409 RepID=UPI003517C842